MQGADDYVSYRQAAEILGIHVSNIVAHVQRGNLPTRGRSDDDPHRPSLLRADVERLGREIADRARRAEARARDLAAARERGAPPDNVSVVAHRSQSLRPAPPAARPVTSHY